jgi:hypothetical protein
MATSYSEFTRYSIDGVVSTNKTVWQNIEAIASAAGAWVTFDQTQGKWAVIINRAEGSSRSFDDSNIVGPISVSTTGLSDLYTTCRVQYPFTDLRDQLDDVLITLPVAYTNSNDPNNTLEISYDIVNNAEQAQELGLLELLQTRVDRVIRFNTDFSEFGILAGDIIDVTNEPLGFVNALFRVVTLSETDNEQGGIDLEITALQYDPGIYDIDVDELIVNETTGITAIGLIGTPGTPVLTSSSINVQPAISVVSTSPSGVVEGMEFWQSPDNTNYVLINIERPSGGGVYSTGSSVETKFLKSTAGNAYFTRGPFSAAVGVAFDPTQVTDAVGSNTELLYANNTPITLLQPLSSSLNSVDTFLNGGSNMANAVFNSYNSTYDGLYGTSLAGLPLLLSAGFGITEVTCPATTGYPGGLTYVDSSPTFQPVYGAPYIFQFQVNPIDFAGTGAAGDELAAVVELFDITANVTVNADGSYVSGYALPSLRFVANFTDTLNTANTYQYDLYMVNKSAANVAMDVQWVFNSQTFVGA